jgi:hypothetical protein
MQLDDGLLARDRRDIRALLITILLLIVVVIVVLDVVVGKVAVGFGSGSLALDTEVAGTSLALSWHVIVATKAKAVGSLFHALVGNVGSHSISQELEGMVGLAGLLVSEVLDPLAVVVGRVTDLLALAHRLDEELDGRHLGELALVDEGVDGREDEDGGGRIDGSTAVTLDKLVDEVNGEGLLVFEAAHLLLAVGLPVVVAFVAWRCVLGHGGVLVAVVLAEDGLVGVAAVHHGLGQLDLVHGIRAPEGETLELRLEVVEVPLDQGFGAAVDRAIVHALVVLAAVGVPDLAGDGLRLLLVAAEVVGDGLAPVASAVVLVVGTLLLVGLTGALRLAEVECHARVAAAVRAVPGLIEVSIGGASRGGAHVGSGSLVRDCVGPGRRAGGESWQREMTVIAGRTIGGDGLVGGNGGLVDSGLADSGLADSGLLDGRLGDGGRLVDSGRLVGSDSVPADDRSSLVVDDDALELDHLLGLLGEWALDLLLVERSNSLALAAGAAGGTLLLGRSARSVRTVAGGSTGACQNVSCWPKKIWWIWHGNELLTGVGVGLGHGSAIGKAEESLGGDGLVGREVMGNAEGSHVVEIGD